MEKATIDDLLSHLNDYIESRWRTIEHRESSIQSSGNKEEIASYEKTKKNLESISDLLHSLRVAHRGVDEMIAMTCNVLAYSNDLDKSIETLAPTMEKAAERLNDDFGTMYELRKKLGFTCGTRLYKKYDYFPILAEMLIARFDGYLDYPSVYIDLEDDATENDDEEDAD